MSDKRISIKELDRLRSFPPDSEERFAFLVAVWMDWPAISRALRAGKAVDATEDVDGGDWLSALDELGDAMEAFDD